MVNFSSKVIASTLRIGVDQHTAGVLPTTVERDERPVLVLDLDETLICNKKVKSKKPDAQILDGKYEVQIRPHCIPVLHALAPFYRLVIFTAGGYGYMKAIMALLDPEDALFTASYCHDDLSWRADGNYFKDLSLIMKQLNVSEQKIVILDNTPSAYSAHEANGCPILDYMCESEDKELVIYREIFLKHVGESDFRRVALLIQEMFEERKKDNPLRFHAGSPINPDHAGSPINPDTSHPVKRQREEAMDQMPPSKRRRVAVEHPVKRQREEAMDQMPPSKRRRVAVEHPVKRQREEAMDQMPPSKRRRVAVEHPVKRQREEAMDQMQDDDSDSLVFSFHEEDDFNSLQYSSDEDDSDDSLQYSSDEDESLVSRIDHFDDDEVSTFSSPPEVISIAELTPEPELEDDDSDSLVFSFHEEDDFNSLQYSSDEDDSHEDESLVSRIDHFDDDEVSTFSSPPEVILIAELTPEPELEEEVSSETEVSSEAKALGTFYTTTPDKTGKRVSVRRSRRLATKKY